MTLRKCLGLKATRFQIQVRRLWWKRQNKQTKKTVYGCIKVFCVSFSVEGGRGREPGRTGGGRGAGGARETGEERAGGGISTMAESGREIQKGKLLLFVTAYFQSKKRTQERFLTSI